MDRHDAKAKTWHGWRKKKKRVKLKICLPGKSLKSTIWLYLVFPTPRAPANSESQLFGVALSRQQLGLRAADFCFLGCPSLLDGSH
jgi:hypothetical protein